jgi:protein SCO1/2
MSKDYARPGEEGYEDGPGWKAFLRRHVWVVGIVMGLALITISRPFLQHRPPPPLVLFEIPAFDLLDQEGAAFTHEDLEGRVWVVGFIFTRCPSVCPAVTQAMTRFQEQIARSQLEDHVNLLTITVDPEHDTPEILAEYAETVGADQSTWRFVTGSDEAIRSLVVDGFMLHLGEKQPRDAGVFDIAHKTELALVDRHGKVRGFWGIDDESLNELYHRSIATMRAGPETP